MNSIPMNIGSLPYTLHLVMPHRGVAISPNTSPPQVVVENGEEAIVKADFMQFSYYIYNKDEQHEYPYNAIIPLDGNALLKQWIEKNVGKGI